MIEKHTILNTASIRDALEKINALSGDASLVLFVVDNENKVFGTITDGDIRRGLLEGKSIADDVTTIMHSDFQFITDLNDYKAIRELRKKLIFVVPFVDSNKHLIDLLDLQKLRAVLPVDAVIMAGGKGVRLKPYTNDVPKPMLALDGKPIIAHNIDRLLSYGIKNIFISVNHLKEQIIDYCNENYKDVNITFIEEDRPLGTLGSLSLVDEFMHDDVLVLNADILSNINFFDFYDDFKTQNMDMSIATFDFVVNVPYAILDTDGSKINSFIEKPSYTYYSNAGMYMIKKSSLSKIPVNEPYDATDLMNDLIADHKNVCHFPIRGYWLDIGNAKNYAKAQQDIRYIKF